jgi:long-chain acyl-CoA synthetase
MSKNMKTVTEHVWSRICAEPTKLAMRVTIQKPTEAKPRVVGITWHEYGLMVAQAALFLRQAGMKKGERVAMIGDCTPEWAVINRAIQSLGGIIVGIYGDSTPDQVAHILKDSGASLLLIENNEDWGRLSAGVDILLKPHSFAQVLPHVADRKEIDKEFWRLRLTYDQKLLNFGIDAESPVQLDDVCSLIYTSGSTGTPKGVVLTHRTLAASCESLARRGFNFDSRDTFLHYLTFVHVYGWANGLEIAERFGTISCFCTKEGLKEALALYKPTVMLGVPRVWNRFKKGIETQIQNKPGLQGKIARWALAGEKKGFRQLIAELLVFSKIRRKLGAQRLRILLSGSAAIPVETVKFFNAIGLTLREGYGLTETCGGICANTLDDNKFGSLGKPIDGVEIKIVPDPDFPDANTGVLWVRGDCVFKGYWNMPEKNKEVFDQENWFNTGDIVYQDEDGFLWYRGRKSRNKKLDTGKFYSEEKIQAAIDGSSIVSAVVPTGEGRAFVGALIFIDPEAAKELVGQNQLPEPGNELLFYARHPAVRHAVAEAVARANNSLQPWERVKHWEIVPVVPTVKNGLLTNTQKIRIEAAKMRFLPQIEEIHSRTRDENSEHSNPAAH